MKDQTQHMPGSHEGWLAKTGGYAKDMTLRDYFAAKAMQVLLGRSVTKSDWDATPKDAYEMADAMLKAGE